jgi:CheY-like chemotaxis protein
MSEPIAQSHRIVVRTLLIISFLTFSILAKHLILRYSKELLSSLSVTLCALSLYKKHNLFRFSICLLFFLDTEDFFIYFNIPTFLYGCTLYFTHQASGKKIRVNQENLRSILYFLKHKLSDDFFAIIQNGVIKESSDSISVFTEPPLLEGMKDYLLEPYWELFQNTLTRCLENGQSVASLKSREGSIIEINLCRIPWGDKPAVFMVGSIKDNQHFALKKAGQAILHSLSNDLNTPLNILSGVISDLISSSELSSEDSDRLKIAYNCSEVLSDMITYFLELSQMNLFAISPKQHKEFIPEMLLEEAIQQAKLYADSRQNDVKCIYYDDLKEKVWGDSRSIKGAVNRVILLAFAHTAGPGIEVDASRYEEIQTICRLQILIKFPFTKLVNLEDSVSILTRACFNDAYLQNIILDEDITHTPFQQTDIILDVAIALSLVRARVSQSGGSFQLNIQDSILEILITFPIADSAEQILQYLKDKHSVNSPGIQLKSFDEFPDGEYPRFPSSTFTHPSTFTRAFSSKLGHETHRRFSITSLPIKFNTTNSFTEFERSYRVLLVDDSKFNQQVMQSMLMRLGFENMTADNGLEALNIYQRFHADIDCILMDCDMPVMDGIASTRQIRNYEKTNLIPCVPIIAVTADVLDFNQNACLHAGMNEFCTKPIDINTLRKILSKYFK